MGKIAVGPQNVQSALDNARPGDEIVLLAGKYTQPLSVTRSGEPGSPIVISAESGAEIDGGRSAESYRHEANRRSKEVGQDMCGSKLCYPGVWPDVHKAYLSFLRADWIELRGQNLRIRQCWPTAIYLRDSQHIKILDLTMRDATFAIGAVGKRTQYLTIKGCNWIQDVSKNTIWRTARWDFMHNPSKNGLYDNHYRHFDGDFFRSVGIAGDVEIAHCSIRHAFNAIHIYNDKKDSTLSRNFDIHDNEFRFVRDNVFEPETVAFNLWFYRNTIFNCHKWFSVELEKSGFFYVFSNRGWFDEIPGPPDDDHRGGGVFKTPKAKLTLSRPHYFFHNSFNLRSDYIRNWVLTDLWHFANAIRYCKPGEPGYDENGQFFGDLTKPAKPPADRFTTDWAEHAINFADDIVDHSEYLAALVAAGYGPFPNCLAMDPRFRDPLNPGPYGDGFKLKTGSKAAGLGGARKIVLPDGSVTNLLAGRDAGAWQGDTLFAWESYRRMSVNLA